MKQNSINTLLAVGLVTTGIIVGIKNHKRDGFWSGALAVFLIAGLTIKVTSPNTFSNKIASK